MYQLIPIEAEWIIILSLVFSLSLFMTFMTDKQTDTFFVFLTIFIGFAVFADLLDLWILIVCLIIITLLIIMNMKNKEGL